jgi:tartrate dehydratase alpha subunit/fumarate hydratase class I-like protein
MKIYSVTYITDTGTYRDAFSNRRDAERRCRELKKQATQEAEEQNHGIGQYGGFTGIEVVCDVVVSEYPITAKGLLAAFSHGC